MPNRQTTHLGLAGIVLLIASVGAGCAAAINPLQVEAAQTAARVKTALVNDSRVGTRAIEVRVRTAWRCSPARSRPPKRPPMPWPWRSACGRDEWSRD